MKKTFLTIIILVVITVLLCGCTADSGEKIIFGTFYNIKLKGTNSQDNLKNIENTLINIENKISTSKIDSDISKINTSKQNEPILVSDITIVLFKNALQIYNNTNRAFNPAIFPLIELWDFSPDTFIGYKSEIPSPEEINNTLNFCNMENFILNERNKTITKTNVNSKLDFGGIAKGYAVDIAYELSKESNDGIINIGGNIRTFGNEKKIGVTDPRKTNEIFGIINLQNQSIATSGDYERYYKINNIRYHHILDKTGYPTGIYSENPIISVSIIGESAMLCDAYSTAVMILGIEWAKDNLPENYSCIVIKENTYSIIGDMDFILRQNSYGKI